MIKIKPLRIARFYYPSLSYEGVGMAMVIYFQGCHNRCVGCHNEELQQIDGGTEYIYGADALSEINKITGYDTIDSFVFSGGEPLHQDHSKLYSFIRLLKDQYHKPMWLYTSYLFDDIPSKPDFKLLFDVIVDGPFDITKNRPGLKFRGSTNQNIYVKVGSLFGIWTEHEST